MKRAAWSRLELAGDYVMDSAFRIGAGDNDVLLDRDGRPYIPGSTLRGALRAYTESFLRAMDSDALTEVREVLISGTQGNSIPMLRRVALCCDSVDRPVNSTSYQGCLTEGIVALWRADPLLQSTLNDALTACTCHTCRVFGAPWLAAKIVVADMPLRGTWNGLYEARGGLALSRDAGVTIHGSPYTRRALPARLRFTFRLVMEDADFAEQGMVLLGLRALELGWVPLGADRARGLGQGHLELNWAACRYLDATSLVQTLLLKQAAPFSGQDAEVRIAAFSDLINGLIARV